MPTLALRTSKSAKNMSNFCPPPVGIILKFVHCLLRTLLCFLTFLQKLFRSSPQRVQLLSKTERDNNKAETLAQRLQLYAGPARHDNGSELCRDDKLY